MDDRQVQGGLIRAAIVAPAAAASRGTQAAAELAQPQFDPHGQERITIGTLLDVLAGMGHQRQQADEPQHRIVRRRRLPVVLTRAAHRIDEFAQRHRANTQAIQVPKKVLERDMLLEPLSQLDPERHRIDRARIDRCAKPERMLGRDVRVRAVVLERGSVS